MNMPDQVAKLCQGLSPDKQEEVLDFVEFLVSRQLHTSWTVAQRQEAVARTMGCLRHTRTSSEAFAQRKPDEKAHTAWTNTLALPLLLRRDADDAFVQRLGVIKVEARVSFADAFALALQSGCISR